MNLLVVVAPGASETLVQQQTGSRILPVMF
ncbi:hypothetical protein DFR24_1276 [Panacagrimonas perspica]|uniref:Uncharacterized protein n=1 Tax=Panacagrimonas perspica TaxID=381431 RepID=A0A4R7PDR1_9GAMM|nr:hypothetical protein DFR24_1276 [Panacagrimonas perspica]